MADSLRGNGVDPVVAGQSNDIFDTTGWLPFDTPGTIGQLENEIRAEHQTDGIRKASESGGKRRPGRAVKGNGHLRATLAECAQAAARTEGFRFQSCHKSLMLRKGCRRAVIATARKMLRVIHSVLRSGKPYRDPEADHEALMVRRNAPRWIRMLQAHGHLSAPDGTTDPDEAAAVN